MGGAADVLSTVFVLDRVKALAPQHPEWKDKEPFASLLKGDVKAALAGGEHAPSAKSSWPRTPGMTTEEFEKIVKDWIATAKHPMTKRRYTEMVYQPMLELLAYLRANGFKTFIVSGGGIEFMRPWTEKVYGIPPEQVDRQQHQDEVRDARRQAGARALPEMQLHRRQGRQARRHPAAHRPAPHRRVRQLRRRPADAAVDRRSAAARASGLCVHHTDAEREWAYDRKSHIGRLDKALDEANAKGWTVVSMKNDWKVILPNGKN